MADGLSPQERAWFRLQRETLRAQERQAERVLKAERIRSRRDIGMSMMQASATNPMWSQVAMGLMGATIATLGGVVGRTVDTFVPQNTKARRLFAPGEFLGQSHFETLGEGMMLAAAAKGTAQEVTGLVAALRGQSTAQSIAFDIPDSEGAVMLAAQAGGPPFPVPAVPTPRRRANPKGS